jgi:transposase-like protein
MEKESIVRRKSYTAMFKLEIVDFAKEKGNREAARKFNVGGQRTGMEERRSGHKVFTSKETCNEVQEMLLART